MEQNLINLIQEAGIVGAGGAGFPTHVKVNAKAEYVLVNGAECEPLLRVDQQLMVHQAEDFLAGLKAVVKETGAKKGIIALKGKYKAAINKLEAMIANEPQLEIFLLKDFYPAGDEQVTVYEALGRIVPEGGIPLNVGVVVCNVETLVNIARAIKGVPVTQKYMTITGAVRNPITLKVPVGLTIREMIDLAGGATVEEFGVIDGGPMMGKLVRDIDAPTTKTSKGYIVLPKDHFLIESKGRPIEDMLRQAKTACCHCSLCTEVCPRNLLGHKLHPDKIIRLASYGSTCDANAQATEAFLCCECGLCQPACIMDLQPWKLNQFLKGKMAQQGLKNPYHNAPEQVNPFRAYRRFPVKKLISRLKLDEYNVDAPLVEDLSKDFKTVTLPLRQHIGAPAEPLVQVGDQVTEGQLIADMQPGKLGAKIHASISGTVVAIGEKGITISK